MANGVMKPLKKPIKAIQGIPKAITGAPGKIKKSATVKNAKSYGKVALALTTAGVGYAAVQETAKGVTRALAPEEFSNNLEWRFSNTEVGLAGQTLLFIAASNMAGKVLDDMGLISRKESSIVANAGMGLAIGRHLMGTSLFDFGKRFEYLLDGEMGAALYPGRGPAITLPQNAVAASEVVTMNAGGGYSVENAYLQNRVDRGMPHNVAGETVYKNGSKLQPFTAPSYI